MSGTRPTDDRLTTETRNRIKQLKKIDILVVVTEKMP